MRLRAVLRDLIPAGLLALAFSAACGTTHPAPDASPQSNVHAPRQAAPGPFAADPQLMQSLSAELEKLSASRSASAAPAHGTLTATATARDDGMLLLHWEHSQRGDYDLNGETNVSDLAVLGSYFGLTSASEVWDEARRADGDGNGALTLADVGAIGMAFGESTLKYLVETDNPDAAAPGSPDSGTGWYFVAEVPLSAGSAEAFAAARVYEHAIGGWQPGNYRITAIDSSGQPGVSGVAAAASLRGDWWMAGANAQHTSLSTHTGPVTSHIAWTLELEGAATYPVLDALGNIYLGADSGLSCVRPDGNVAWTSSTPAQVTGTPAIADNGFIYFGCSDGTLHAVRPGGEPAWVYNAGGPILCPVTLGPEGQIYFGCNDGKVYCLHSDGTFDWSWQTLVDEWRDQVVLDSTGHILAKATLAAPPEWGGSLSGIFVLGLDGTLVRNLPIGSEPCSLPLIADVTLQGDGAPSECAVFTTNYGLKAVSLQTLSSDTLDETTLDSAASPLVPPTLNPAGTGVYYMNDAFDGGLNFRAFAQAAPTVLYAPLSDSFGGLASDDEGSIFMSGSTYGLNELYAFKANGDVTWEIPLVPPGAGPPAIAEGSLYYTTYNGLIAIGGELSGTRPGPPSGVEGYAINETDIRIKWNSANGADGYEVYQEGVANPIGVVAAGDNYPYTYAPAEYLYHADNLEPGTAYGFYVIATNAYGASDPSPTGIIATKLGQVANLSASDALYPDKVELTWDPVPNATGYHISRSIGSGSYSSNTDLSIEVGNVTSFTDLGVPDWDVRSYNVRAINAVASGGNSEYDTGSLQRGTGPAGPGEWAMHDHDLAQTRRSTVLGPASEPSVISNIELGEFDRFKPYFSAFASDGSGYYGNGINSQLGIAFDPDGTLRYTANGASYFYSSVAADGALVCHAFRSDSSPMLTVVNPDGTQRSQFPELNVYAGSPLGGGDYIGAGPFGITRFDLDGNVVWDYTMPLFNRSPLSQPPLVGSGGSIYFATRAKVYLSGQVPQQGPPGGPGGGGPPPPPPTHYLYALNPDGTFNWRFDQDGYVYDMALAADNTTYMCVGDGDYLYNSSFGHVLAVGSDGVQDWSFDALEPNRICVAGDGKVVLTFATGATALNPDGSVAWDFPLGAWSSDILLDAADNCYFFSAVGREGGSGNDITLHSLDAGGNERWSMPLADAYFTHSLALRDDGALLLTLQEGSNGSSGSVRMVLLQ